MIEKIARVKITLDPEKITLDEDILQEAKKSIEALLIEGLDTLYDTQLPISTIVITGCEFLGWES